MAIKVYEASLPCVESLSSHQQRGVHCVWCGTALLNGTARDLGPRPIGAHGTSALWFPRCCPTCWKGHAL
ncbi:MULTISPECIES: hypothetical protein [unclassified Streptomyces]|uniref:hypothetical protein n=1 Tax=unclassified Streptomyces TaxID=2593676 RepID=UPI003331B781